MNWSQLYERTLFRSAALFFTILSITYSAGTWAEMVSPDGLWQVLEEVELSPRYESSASSTGDSPQADDASRSTRSAPPDTTPYTRPVVPEDYAPLGKPAIPPGIWVPPPDQTLCKQTDDLRDSGGL